MGPTGVGRRVGLGGERACEHATRACVAVVDRGQKQVGGIDSYDESAVSECGVRMRGSKVSMPELGGPEPGGGVCCAVIEASV